MAIDQEKINQLAKYLEKLPEERFDMGEGAMPACGSAACIAGHAAELFGVPGTEENAHAVDFIAVSRKLGLPQQNSLEEGMFGLGRMAYQLFFAREWQDRRFLTWLTKDQAVFVLRYLAKTGMVDWDYAVEMRPKKTVSGRAGSDPSISSD